MTREEPKRVDVVAVAVAYVVSCSCSLLK